MTSTRAKLTPEQAKVTGRALPVMFFTQGFIALATVPRIPELMDHLHFTAADWGFVGGIAGAMGLFSMFFGARIVRRFATMPVMLATSTTFCISVGSYGFLTNGTQYFAMAALFSMVMSLYNLSLNTNAVTFQKRQKKVVLGKFHASWSIGATVTTAVGGILANLLPLNLHLVLLSVISLSAFWIFGRRILPPALDGHAERKNGGNRVPFFKSPKLLWLIAAGNITGVMCEAMLINWSSYFTQKTLAMPLAISAIPYTLFGLAMIIGRLSISRFAQKLHFSEIAKRGGLFGSISLLLAAFVPLAIPADQPVARMVVLSFFWIITGFGVAPMMPSWASATGSVPKLETTAAMARVTLVNYILLMGANILMGHLVDAFGLQFAFIFVVACFLTASMLAGVVANHLKGDEIDPNAFPETGAVTIID